MPKFSLLSSIESTNKNGCNTFALKYTWIRYNQPRKVAYAVLSSVALLQGVSTSFGLKKSHFLQHCEVRLL